MTVALQLYKRDIKSQKYNKNMVEGAEVNIEVSNMKVSYTY